MKPLGRIVYVFRLSALFASHESIEIYKMLGCKVSDVFVLAFAIIAAIAGFNCFNYILEAQTQFLSMSMAASFLMSFLSFIVVFRKIDKTDLLF